MDSGESPMGRFLNKVGKIFNEDNATLAALPSTEISGDGDGAATNRGIIEALPYERKTTLNVEKSKLKLELLDKDYTRMKANFKASGSNNPDPHAFCNGNNQVLLYFFYRNGLEESVQDVGTGVIVVPETTRTRKRSREGRFSESWPYSLTTHQCSVRILITTNNSRCAGEQLG